MHRKSQEIGLPPSRESDRKIFAIILAAGRGMRLHPITADIPKCLVDVRNKPILDWQIRALLKFGISNIAIVVGFQKEKIVSYVNHNFPDLAIQFVENAEFATTDTLFSLAEAAKYLKQAREVYLLNGDVVFDPKLLPFLGPHRTSWAAARVGLCDEEEIKIRAARGLVIGLNKRINPRRAIGEAVGLYKFSKEFWADLSLRLKRLQRKHKREYYEFAIEEVIRGGRKLYFYGVHPYFVKEVDFLSDLKEARAADLL